MPATKTSRKPAAKKSGEPVKLSSIYARVASKKNIDTTRAAKLVRAKARANFDEIVKLSPNVKQSKQSANDGNRWPESLSSDAATFLLGKFGVES